MTESIKYIAEYNSLYGLIGFLFLCSLQGYVTSLIYKVVMKIVPFIIKKLAKYNDIYTKVQNKDISVEINLYKNENTKG